MLSKYVLRSILWLGITTAVTGGSLWADGPADNNPQSVRAVPPPGLELPAEVSRELHSAAISLQQQLAHLTPERPTAAQARRLAFCGVIPRAVLMALDTQMFYSEREVQAARQLLQLGQQRAAALARGGGDAELLGVTSQVPLPLQAPLAIVAGFRSRIDDSIQPYGLVLPVGWQPDDHRPRRLDVWLHGRGERVSEATFLQQRLTNLGEYTPADTIVLHPYGRYCNAFKFAGEIDVLEAIEHVQQWLPIDQDRIVIRGFSMGGAGCWQLAVHYPQLWAAANPGAGFSETTEFLRVFQNEVITPTDFQQRLLHWYDCPDWTNNLRQVPTVAYSGENDRQKQAADVMAAAFAQRGMQLPHIIGPNTEHKIHADSKVEIEDFLSASLAQPRSAVPQQIDLTTYTLRYHQLAWLAIEGLNEHWQESRVQAQWQPEQQQIALTTQGVTHLRLQFPSLPQSPTQAIRTVVIDGQPVATAEVWPAPQQPLFLQRQSDGQWHVAAAETSVAASPLRKRPGSTGPIDDAFMDRFTMLGPATADSAAATPQPSTVDAWADREFQRAAEQWKFHFRGDPPLADSQALEQLDRQQNLILFGRPSTNPALAELVKHLPIQWDEQRLVVNGRTYPAETHVPIMIYPQPEHPEHYVVLNSGFTYREYAYLNNARQVPMLPDWAVVDVSQGATSQLPGKIVDAGFFNEQWQFP